ncbi:MAG: AbrB family transcriptional regulator [Planctomycetes bacterium]|nr:AbrB family transcriptional regulator [Planctomycetota bacterium]
MKITSKGQVTIPAAIRERLGLLPETEVEFAVEGDAVKLSKKQSAGGARRGQRVIGQLRGSATVRMTTDEIMSLTRDPWGCAGR